MECEMNNGLVEKITKIGEGILYVLAQIGLYQPKNYPSAARQTSEAPRLPMTGYELRQYYSRETTTDINKFGLEKKVG